MDHQHSVATYEHPFSPSAETVAEAIRESRGQCNPREITIPIEAAQAYLWLMAAAERLVNALEAEGRIDDQLVAMNEAIAMGEEFQPELPLSDWPLECLEWALCKVQHRLPCLSGKGDSYDAAKAQLRQIVREIETRRPLRSFEIGLR